MTAQGYIISSCGRISLTDLKEVERLAARIGNGALMQLASEMWGDLLETEYGFRGGEFSVGPCVAQLVSCSHPIRDNNGHCEVCCGNGRVTKWVAQAATEILQLRAELAAERAKAVSVADMLKTVVTLLRKP